MDNTVYDVMKRKYPNVVLIIKEGNFHYVCNDDAKTLRKYTKRFPIVEGQIKSRDPFRMIEALENNDVKYKIIDVDEYEADAVVNNEVIESGDRAGMNEIALLISQIAQGVDPTSGEIFEIEELRGNVDVELALYRLLNAYYRPKSQRGVYAKMENDYPEHAVIMKEGFFFSAHNKSAYVLRWSMDYNIGLDMFGRPTTGGPDIDKIVNTLMVNNISFIVVESGAIVTKFDGDNPFDNMERLETRTFASTQTPTPTNESEKSVNERLLYPDCLVCDIFSLQPDAYNTFKVELGNDYIERVEKALEELPPREKNILKMRYRDGYTLAEIGKEYDLSRERIRQLANKATRKLGRKNIKDYLLGRTDSITKAKGKITGNSNGLDKTKPLHIMTENEMEQYPFVYDQKVSLLKIAGSINQFRNKEATRAVTNIEIAEWLCSLQYLKKEMTEDGRRTIPTQIGYETGFDLEERTSKSGDNYILLVCDYNAQKFIVNNYHRMMEDNRTSASYVEVEEEPVPVKCNKCMLFRNETCFGKSAICEDFIASVDIPEEEMANWPKEMHGPYGTLHKNRY